MKVALYSCEGCSREVLPVLKENAQVDPETAGELDVVFVDDNPKYQGKVVNGIPVISFSDLCRENNRDRRVSIAIADPKIREKLVGRCRQEGFEFLDIIASSASIYDENSIGEGLIMCAHTMITSNVTIGRHFQCNYYSYVAHDCIIGDYVTFAPRVGCNGRIKIDDYAYIGSGAVFKQGVPDRYLHVGEGAVVGMGAVVTKDVPPYATVVGNPARIV